MSPKTSAPRFFPMPTGSSGVAGWHHIKPFVECPQRYQYERVRGVTKFQRFMPDALGIGLLLHAARAQWLYDKRSPDSPWEEAMERYAERLQADEKKTLNPASMHHAKRDFAGYVKYWRVHPTSEILAIEHKLNPRGLVSDAPEWTFRTARLDSIERINNKVWIGELKSTGRGAKAVQDEYTLNGQILLQVALWGPEETKNYGPLAGVMLDILVKGDDKKPGTGSPRVKIPIASIAHALEWFKKDFPQWVMQASSIRWNDTVPRRPVTGMCWGPHGPCTYQALCSQGRAGVTGYVLADGTKLSQWTPSEGREVPPWK